MVANSVNTVDDLLAGPTEISWLLFEHVQPIIREYLEKGRVISIDDVFLDKAGRKNKKEAETARRTAEEEITRRSKCWIEEGLNDLYAAQTLFEREMRRAEEPKPTDTHIYETYEKYHLDYVKHLGSIIKARTLLEKT